MKIGLIALSFLGDLNNNNNKINNLEDELIYDPVTLKRLKDLNKTKKKTLFFLSFNKINYFETLSMINCIFYFFCLFKIILSTLYSINKINFYNNSKRKNRLDEINSNKFYNVNNNNNRQKIIMQI